VSGFVDDALAAARAGAAVVADAARTRDFRVETKSRADFVTEVDRTSERAIVELLRAAYPDHGVLGEEGGASGPSGAEHVWVIDPLDGTTNFIRGIPFFAVAVGLERRGVPVAAAIVDPLRGETWTAARGEGARHDGEPMRVSAAGTPGESLVLTGIPFRDLSPLPRYLPGLERMARATAGIRRMGSAALDLASIAEGRAEAFWEFGLARWDVSAGSLLVEEAGGRVTDLRGGSTHLATGDVLASNGLVHDALVDLLSER
jgi:myo-inositol-1(or 4)-monophosphatase